MDKNKKKSSDISSLDRSKRLFLIIASAFLACVLTVGIIIGAIGIFRNNSSVMRYKGVYLKDGVANYLATVYKYDFMSSLTKSGIECFDSEYFWQSESEDGRTYAEVLSENTEEYLKRVIVGSYLFDKNTRMQKSDKEVVERAVSDVLIYRADGSVDRFNEIACDMGFTYKDFERAAEMLYKYEMAKTVIFGIDGSALESGKFDAECNEYFESAYSHVKLLLMRTDGETVLDPDTGKEVFSEYDDTTRAQINADIAKVREWINNHNNDVGDEQMSEALFDEYIKKYKTGTVNDTEGYYFSPNSSYTIEFAADAPDIVSLAFSTEIGYYGECELDIGVAFVLRCPLEDGAYSRISLSHFFEDFYKNAASYLYTESFLEYTREVTVNTKRYNATDIVSLPYNHELSVKFG